MEITTTTVLSLVTAVVGALVWRLFEQHGRINTLESKILSHEDLCEVRVMNLTERHSDTQKAIEKLDGKVDRIDQKLDAALERLERRAHPRT